MRGWDVLWPDSVAVVAREVFEFAHRRVRVCVRVDDVFVRRVV